MRNNKKHNINRELESHLGNLSNNITLRDNKVQVGEDEIEIDLYDLNNDTSFKIRKNQSVTCQKLYSG